MEKTGKRTFINYLKKIINVPQVKVETVDNGYIYRLSAPESVLNERCSNGSVATAIQNRLNKNKKVNGVRGWFMNPKGYGKYALVIMHKNIEVTTENAETLNQLHLSTVIQTTETDYSQRVPKEVITYEYDSKENLSVKQLKTVLEYKGIYLNGTEEFTKKKLVYTKTGEVFRHTVKQVKE